MALLVVLAAPFASLLAQTRLVVKDSRVLFTDGKDTLKTPAEGLWSVTTGWKDDWMTLWKHSRPEKVETIGSWTILRGSASIGNGILELSDFYTSTPEGMVRCIRRFEWKGPDTLRNVTLSVRLQEKGEGLSLFAPGTVYYGNKNGASVDPSRVPVWNGRSGEFAIFEDHRYPMPFIMLENPSTLRAAAVHIVPSPVRGAVVPDQWWSLGVEAGKGVTEFVIYSGPVGYNGKRSVVKALQRNSLPYTDTFIDMEPGQVIEKEFLVDLYGISRPGTGFQRPVYQSLDRYKPYDAERFDTFDEIVSSKYNYSLSRWMENDQAAGFDMYDSRYGRKDIVMGWCGQADSPGYALQVLGPKLGDPSIHDKVQRSLDFLTGAEFLGDGIFAVRYDFLKGTWDQGDPVSCGQAMYNFAKAIETARKSKEYDTSKWERFLRKACDSASDHILSKEWNPKSTAEGFYIAPLAIASELFGVKRYRKAAEKAAAEFASRHLEMDGCYWGGTLDATCEDKEGSWAAFQGFLECYERFSDRKYLDWAKHAMDVCLSYVVVWDIPLQAGRMADHAVKTTGWTVVSPQNQHIDVYGVLFAPEVCKMGRYLGDERLVKLSRVMYRSCFQLTDPFGSQGEQLQHTNFAQHGIVTDVVNLRGGYVENWTVFWITAHFLNAAARFTEMGEEV
ncbi:MAG: hypothetical protein IK076_05320 [Bacteroidales bacterium]|nr:hypothetical protein [Bacteroidales bacterium]